MEETFPIAFGRYELVERLAVGGMAELFKAQVSGAHGFQKTVVIKRILPHLAQDLHFNTMFIDEAKITARLSHPKIAQTLELGKFNGQLYIAMEYVDGLDVLAMLRECAHRRTKIPLPVAVHVIMEVLDALDFAHQQTDADGKPLNIVHRDISPSNILVSRRGDVKLVDFGIAQAAEREQQTQSGTLKGKYGYMAPEQVVGRDLDRRSDLFSCGIVLAEMAMGRRLFVSPNELDVLLMVRDVKLDRLDRYGDGLDAMLLAVVRKALGKRPEERYQTCGEFRDALGEWMFDKRHRVTAKDVAALVGDLYEAAWERKRARKQPELERQMAAAQAAVAHRVAATGTEPAGTPAPPAADEPVEFPVSASMEEAIALVAGEREGIPMGEIDAGESMPVVLVEHEPKPAAKAPAPPPAEAKRPTPPAPPARDEVLDLDIDFSELDEIESPGPEGGGYELDELARELRQREPSDRIPVTSAVAREDSEPTTQEIAFDDIVSAVQHAMPRDESGQVIAPSPDAMQQALRRRPTLQPVARTPDDRGDLAEIASLRVLSRLAASRATGLLVVGIGGIRKEIYIVDGRPEFVSSNLASELFGEYLVAQKVISEGELSMALAMMPHYGGKLGDTLVGLGLMKPLDVFRHLTRQVRDKLIDVCTWEKGTFEWFDSERNEREAFPLDLDPYEVLGAGAMAVSFSRVEAWLDGARDVAYRSAMSADVAPESFHLGSELRDAYNLLDGRRTIADLLARYDDRSLRERFARFLYLLVMSELAHRV